MKKEAALAKRKRCAWSGTDPLFVVYHDEEWGVPIHEIASSSSSSSSMVPRPG